MVRLARDKDVPPDRWKGWSVTVSTDAGPIGTGLVPTGLGEAVRLRREERGLGQEQLAASLGVRQQTVSRWENGLAVPRPGRVVELARLLDLEPAVLHRLAGYLPASDASTVTAAWQEVHAHMAELSRAELLLLIERAWEELRLREQAGGGSDARAAG